MNQEIQKAKMHRKNEVINGVKVRQFFQDLTEWIDNLQKNINFDISRERVFPFLCEDIARWNQGQVELPNGYTVDVDAFKIDFDVATEQLRNQVLTNKEKLAQLEGYKESIRGMCKNDISDDFERDVIISMIDDRIKSKNDALKIVDGKAVFFSDGVESLPIKVRK